MAVFKMMQERLGEVNKRKVKKFTSTNKKLKGAYEYKCGEIRLITYPLGGNFASICAIYQKKGDWPNEAQDKYEPRVQQARELKKQFKGKKAKDKDQSMIDENLRFFEEETMPLLERKQLKIDVNTGLSILNAEKNENYSRDTLKKMKKVDLQVRNTSASIPSVQADSLLNENTVVEYHEFTDEALNDMQDFEIAQESKGRAR